MEAELAELDRNIEALRTIRAARVALEKVREAIRVLPDDWQYWVIETAQKELPDIV